MNEYLRQFPEDERRGPGRPRANDADLFDASVWLVHIAPGGPVPAEHLSDVAALMIASDVPAIAALVGGRAQRTIQNALSRQRARLAAAVECQPAEMLPVLHFWNWSSAQDWAEALDLPCVWYPWATALMERSGVKIASASIIHPRARPGVELAMLIHKHLKLLPIRERGEAKRLCNMLIEMQEKENDRLRCCTEIGSK